MPVWGLEGFNFTSLYWKKVTSRSESLPAKKDWKDAFLEF
jgi:hypothetical protein